MNLWLQSSAPMLLGRSRCTEMKFEVMGFPSAASAPRQHSSLLRSKSQMSISQSWVSSLFDLSTPQQWVSKGSSSTDPIIMHSYYNSEMNLDGSNLMKGVTTQWSTYSFSRTRCLYYGSRESPNVDLKSGYFHPISSSPLFSPPIVSQLTLYTIVIIAKKKTHQHIFSSGNGRIMISIAERPPMAVQPRQWLFLISSSCVSVEVNIETSALRQHSQAIHIHFGDLNKGHPWFVLHQADWAITPTVHQHWPKRKAGRKKIPDLGYGERRWGIVHSKPIVTSLRTRHHRDTQPKSKILVILKVCMHHNFDIPYPWRRKSSAYKGAKFTRV